MYFPQTMMGQMQMGNVPMQPFPYLPQAQQAQSGINGVTEVTGLAGAQACQVPAGTTALLMDSTDPMFYIKSVNAQGIATIKQYRFEEYDPQAAALSGYVTRAEFDEWRKGIESDHNQPAATAATAAAEPAPSVQPVQAGYDAGTSATDGARQAQQW